MAIVNRDNDASQQRDIYNESVATVTGATYNLMTVTAPGQLMAAQTASCGLSGAPNHSLWVQRFIVGTGITSFNIGNSMVITTFGTSGSQGYSLPNAATLSQFLYTGDVLLLSTAAANTATVSTQVTMVVKRLQDIRTDFGV